MNADKAIARIILLTVTALLAGVCGAVVVYAYFMPTPEASIGTERIVLPVRVNAPKEAPKLPAVTLAVVPRKALKPVLGGYSVSDGDIVGFATALTSDGWLATDKAVLAGVADPVVLLPGGSVAAATGTVIDAATGIEFLRVEAKDLGVIAFGESGTLSPGATLFRVYPENRLSSVGLVTAHARVKADPTDVIRDSDSVSDRLVLTDGVGKSLSGSGIVTEAGALVGIAVAPPKGEAESAVAVPIEAVARAMREILKSGALHRPSLGMATVDVSEIASRDPELTRSFGALVATVEPAGPAAAAGIEVGDRVTALGSDVLDGSRTLSDLLARYAIGEKVKLTYVRAGEQAVAELTVTDGVAAKR